MIGEEIHRILRLRAPEAQDMGCAGVRAGAGLRLNRAMVALETTLRAPHVKTSERGRELGCRQAGPRTFA
jgi:hypothetical protein